MGNVGLTFASGPLRIIVDRPKQSKRMTDMINMNATDKIRPTLYYYGVCVCVCIEKNIII